MEKVQKKVQEQEQEKVQERVQKKVEEKERGDGVVVVHLRSVPDSGQDLPSLVVPGSHCTAGIGGS